MRSTRATSLPPARTARRSSRRRSHTNAATRRAHRAGAGTRPRPCRPTRSGTARTTPLLREPCGDVCGATAELDHVEPRDVPEHADLAVGDREDAPRELV